jgi:hypothetical protein
METNTPTFKQHYNQNTGNVPFATRAKLASAVLSKLQTAFGFDLSKLQPPTQPFGEITDQLRQMGRVSVRAESAHSSPAEQTAASSR